MAKKYVEMYFSSNAEVQDPEERGKNERYTQKKTWRAVLS